MRTPFLRQWVVATLAILWMICSFNSTNAQNIWNRTYIQDRPSMRFSSIINLDTTYNIIGVTVNRLPPFYEQFLTAKLNSTGDFVTYKAEPDTTNINTGAYWNAFVKTSTGDFAFAGYGLDSTQHLVFGLMDKYYDSIRIFRYYTPNTFAFQGSGLIQHDDSTYFVTGVYNLNPGFNANVVLVKIDSSGNRLWEKYYDQGNFNFAESIIVLHNGHLMLGAFKNDLNHTNEQANTWLLEVDIDGNIIRQWFDSTDSTYAAYGLRQTQDHGFIYGAQKKALQSVNDVYKIGTVVKLDSNFQKQWCFSDGRYSEETGIYDLEELPDGSFVGCGNKPFYNGDSSMLSGWIVKLTAAGNVVWNRTYAGLKTSFSYNYLTDIDVLPDGSLIAVGQCQNSNQQPSQVGWFLKLDSNGCEIENCLVGIDELQPEPVVTPSIKLYPNPAQNSITIEYTDVSEASKLIVVDALGVLIETKNLGETAGKLNLNTTAYQNGIYLARIEAEGKALLKSKFIILK